MRIKELNTFDQLLSLSTHMFQSGQNRLTCGTVDAISVDDIFDGVEVESGKCC
jgi:hypothetical protein